MQRIDRAAAFSHMAAVLEWLGEGMPWEVPQAYLL